MKFPDNTIIHLIKKTIILFVALIGFCIHTNESVMAGEVEEYAVKAAFTFNFVQFVQWPETSFTNDTDPYHLCLIGDTTIVERFSAINGKKIGARTIYVHRLSSESEKECEECDIIFISRNTDRSISEKIISKVEKKPVLTIGETKGFTKLGGMINFFSKDGRLQFEINTSATKNKGLKISSRLLKLAVIVDGPE